MAPQRMQLDATFTRVRPSPVPAAANNLFAFLAQRFGFTYEANGLNCTKLLGQPDPIKVKTDGKGVAVDATNKGNKGLTTGDCSGKSKGLMGCSGNSTIQKPNGALFFLGELNPGKITRPPAGHVQEP